jgi:arsenate reductase (thioredoxin)
LRRQFKTLCPKKEKFVTEAKPINVLILCTGNSARSILGEALFNHLGGGRVRAFSAGSKPSGTVNPMALKTLEEHDIPLPAEVRSKSWDEFAAPGAPVFDYIFTVCASAAGEACPIWPGHPTTAHWGIADPAHVEPADARRAAFEVAFGALEKRIKAFLALDLQSMTRQEVTAAARLIHEACQ